MLIKGKPEYDTRPKETFMLEFNEVDKMADVPSPRVLNSHLFPRHLSKEIVTKRPRVIHVIRNPKDVAVSYYHHMKQMQGMEDRGLVAFVEGFLDGAFKKGKPLLFPMGRLVGLVVKCPPRERKIPGSNSACKGIFSGPSHTSDSNTGTPVATLAGAWCFRVSAGTGRPGVSTL